MRSQVCEMEGLRMLIRVKLKKIKYCKAPATGVITQVLLENME